MTEHEKLARQYARIYVKAGLKEIGCDEKRDYSKKLEDRIYEYAMKHCNKEKLLSMIMRDDV